MSKNKKVKASPTEFMVPEKMPQFFWSHVHTSRTDESNPVPVPSELKVTKKVVPFTWANCNDLVKQSSKFVAQVRQEEAAAKDQAKREMLTKKVEELRKQQQLAAQSKKDAAATNSDDDKNKKSDADADKQAAKDDDNGKTDDASKKSDVKPAAAPAAAAPTAAQTALKAPVKQQPQRAAPTGGQSIPKLPTDDASKDGQKALRYKCSRPLCEVVDSKETPLFVCSKCKSTHYCSRGLIFC